MVKPVTTKELALRQSMPFEELKQRIATRHQAIVSQVPSIASHLAQDPRATILTGSSPYSDPYFVARTQLIADAMANPQKYAYYLEFVKVGKDAITEVQCVNIAKLLYNYGYITLVKDSSNATIDQAWAQSYIQSTPYETWLKQTETVDLFNPNVPCIDWRYIMIGQSAGANAVPFINRALVHYCNSSNAIISGIAIGNSKLSRINLDASILSSAVFYDSSLEALYYQFLRLMDGMVDPNSGDEIPTQFQNCEISLDASTYKAIQPNMVIWQNALFQNCTLTAFTFSQSYIISLTISACQFIECPNAFDNAYAISIFFDKTSTSNALTLLSFKQINAGSVDSPTFITLSAPDTVTNEIGTYTPKNTTLEFADFTGSSTIYYPQQLSLASVTFAIYQNATVYCYYDDQPLTGDNLHQFLARTKTPILIYPNPPAATATTKPTSSGSEQTTADTSSSVESASTNWFNLGIGFGLLSSVLCCPKLLPLMACAAGGALIGKEVCSPSAASPAYGAFFNSQATAVSPYNDVAPVDSKGIQR